MPDPQQQGESFGSNDAGGSVAPCPLAQQHWIEVVLVGEDGQGIPREKYRLALPDGATVVEGRLDDAGRARVDGIVGPGSCKISFPDLDQDAWVNAEAAGGSGSGAQASGGQASSGPTSSDRASGGPTSGAAASPGGTGPARATATPG